MREVESVCVIKHSCKCTGKEEVEHWIVLLLQHGNNKKIPQCRGYQEVSDTLHCICIELAMVHWFVFLELSMLACGGRISSCHIHTHKSSLFLAIIGRRLSIF